VSTPHWVAPFLEELTASCNVSASARAVGVSSTAVYALRKKDADFACAWDQAVEDASDELEQEARKRALRGVQEPIVYQGQLTPIWERDALGEPLMRSVKDPVTGESAMRPVQKLDPDGNPMWLTITKHSDALLALLLKGRRKRVFADRTELTGADGGPVAMNDVDRAARIAALMELAKQRKQAEDFGDLA
jgi:AcrR family transcriptional regulator